MDIGVLNTVPKSFKLSFWSVHGFPTKLPNGFRQRMTGYCLDIGVLNTVPQSFKLSFWSVNGFPTKLPNGFRQRMTGYGHRSVEYSEM